MINDQMKDIGQSETKQGVVLFIFYFKLQKCAFQEVGGMNAFTALLTFVQLLPVSYRIRKYAETFS